MIHIFVNDEDRKATYIDWKRDEIYEIGFGGTCNYGDYVDIKLEVDEGIVGREFSFHRNTCYIMSEGDFEVTDIVRIVPCISRQTARNVSGYLCFDTRRDYDALAKVYMNGEFLYEERFSSFNQPTYCESSEFPLMGEMCATGDALEIWMGGAKTTYVCEVKGDRYILPANRTLYLRRDTDGKESLLNKLGYGNRREYELVDMESWQLHVQEGYGCPTRAFEKFLTISCETEKGFDYIVMTGHHLHQGGARTSASCRERPRCCQERRHRHIHGRY